MVEVDERDGAKEMKEVVRRALENWQRVYTVIPDCLKWRNRLREYSLQVDIFD